MDPNTPLITYTHAGGGGGHHQSGSFTLTPEGKALLDFAHSRPDEENAAIVKAYGLQWTFTGFDAERYGRLNPNNPARFDRHTGEFFVHGNSSDPGVSIGFPPELLVTKSHR